MVFKILHIVLLASFKYILTIPYAKLIGLSYSQALIAVLIGGIGGFLFFYYISNRLITKFYIAKPYLCKLIPAYFKRRYQIYCERRETKPKRIFSRRSRMIAKIKRTYGLWGIIITTPVFLTIPLGAFLASKYYSHKRNIVPYMLGSIIGWAVFLTTLVHVFPHVFK